MTTDLYFWEVQHWPTFMEKCFSKFNSEIHFRTNFTVPAFSFEKSNCCKTHLLVFKVICSDLTATKISAPLKSMIFWAKKKFLAESMNKTSCVKKVPKLLSVSIIWISKKSVAQKKIVSFLWRCFVLVFRNDQNWILVNLVKSAALISIKASTF